MGKKSILVITTLLVLLLFSCDDNGNAITGEKNYSIEIIDDCEYIRKYDGYNMGYSFTHKGNCNNPIHYQNKITIIDTVEYQLIHK